MKKSDLKYFRELLLEYKKKLDDDLASASHSVRGGQRREISGEISEYHTHPADIASDVCLRQTGLIELGFIHQRLEEVERALERIDTGEYGKCPDCEKEISTERLKVKPEAEYCIVCRVKKYPDKKI